MATLHLSATYGFAGPSASGILGGSRSLAVGLAHLVVMDTKEPSPQFADRSQVTLIEQILPLRAVRAPARQRADDLRPA